MTKDLFDIQLFHGCHMLPELGAGNTTLNKPSVSDLELYALLL